MLENMKESMNSGLGTIVLNLAQQDFFVVQKKLRLIFETALFFLKLRYIKD